MTDTYHRNEQVIRSAAPGSPPDLPSCWRCVRTGRIWATTDDLREKFFLSDMTCLEKVDFTKDWLEHGRTIICPECRGEGKRGGAFR